MHNKSVNVQWLKQTREWHGMRIKLCHSNNVVFETLTSSQMMTEYHGNTYGNAGIVDNCLAGPEGQTLPSCSVCNSHLVSSRVVHKRMLWVQTANTRHRWSASSVRQARTALQARRFLRVWRLQLDVYQQRHLQGQWLRQLCGDKRSDCAGCGTVCLLWWHHHLFDRAEEDWMVRGEEIEARKIYGISDGDVSVQVKQALWRSSEHRGDHIWGQAGEHWRADREELDDHKQW